MKSSSKTRPHKCQKKILKDQNISQILFGEKDYNSKTFFANQYHNTKGAIVKHHHLRFCRLADDGAVKVEDILVEVQQQVQLRPRINAILEFILFGEKKYF